MLFSTNFSRHPGPAAPKGLGPYFNSHSCALCHFNTGPGSAPRLDQSALFSIVMQLSVPGTDEFGGPIPEPRYGGQLNPASIRELTGEGFAFRDRIPVPGRYADGEIYILKEPRYRFEKLSLGAMRPDVQFSPRLAPGLAGMGVLEDIPVATVQAIARQQAAEGYGISGQLNVSWNRRGQKFSPGRFGWKGVQPSVEQQIAGAFAGDMGFSSPLYPEGADCGPENNVRACIESAQAREFEISNEQLADLNAFVRSIPPPQPVRVAPAAGKNLFKSSQCISCHAAIVNRADVPEAYTDLLIHDMGDGLSDRRADHRASGNEWRTPPLWGLGSRPGFVRGRWSLLHDGRAESIEEAILWHGGEAEGAKEWFRNLPAERRAELVEFLESL